MLSERWEPSEMHDELVDTRPVHRPPLVREFVKSLALHAEGYRP